jgi:hypothetical protein
LPIEVGIGKCHGERRRRMDDDPDGVQSASRTSYKAAIIPSTAKGPCPC